MKPIQKFAYLALLLCGCAAAQDTPVAVQLITPLSSSTNHKGDPVSARVLRPENLQGDMVMGHITEAKSGNKIHGKSILNFTFDSLQHGGTSIPISSTITSVSNSKGQANVDEEGRVIRTGGNVGKAAAGTGFGALVGGLAGGAKGAGIGAGIGAAASLILIEVAAEGPKIELAQGAQMDLSVKSGGPALASLPPNQPAAPAAEPPTTSAAVSPEPASAPVTAAAAEPTPASAPAPAGGDQPQLSSVKIDFVPGEKTAFYDDFTDMAEDEPPPHWKLRGHPIELRTGGGIRELYASDGTELTSGSFPGPKNFTFELEWTGTGEMEWKLLNNKNENVINMVVRGEPDEHTASVRVDWSGHGNLGEGKIQTTPSTQTTPVQFALWVQEGRLRAYLNGQRLVDVNQVNADPIDHLNVHLAGYRPNGIRKVRVAESAPDFSTVLSSTGRYVTHGIYFDTDSDRLKVESAPMLKMVARAFEKNPNLKLAIQGYTDSTGDAKHNLDLSKRRAEAVRSVLVTQFNVPADRLTADGFGADKPVAPNDTADGRAQNRRVEFVKQ